MYPVLILPGGEGEGNDSLPWLGLVWREEEEGGREGERKGYPDQVTQPPPWLGLVWRKGGEG